MARSNTEETTEADVLALMQETDPADLSVSPRDGEEPAEEEETEEVEESEEEETEAIEEAEEAEEEPESEEEDGEEAEVDWEEIDPRFRQEYEKVAKEAEKWKSAHAKIQSSWTKQSQSQKDQEKQYGELREHSQALQKWNDFFEQNPQIREVLEREIKKIQDPFANTEVPDYLKEDPAFQYMQKSFAPYVKQLEAKVRSLESKSGAIDSQRVEAENRSYLDGQLQKAGAWIKSSLGREATQEDIKQVLQYMVDKKYYDDGEHAAEVVFRGHYKKLLDQKRGTSLKEKAKKFPSRVKSVNPTRTQGRRDASTPEEAIAMALADQGIS